MTNQPPKRLPIRRVIGYALVIAGIIAVLALTAWVLAAYLDANLSHCAMNSPECF